jgi:hypothetical protein
MNANRFPGYGPGVDICETIAEWFAMDDEETETEVFPVSHFGNVADAIVTMLGERGYVIVHKSEVNAA